MNISNYVTSQNVAEWNEQNISMEYRWVKVFKHISCLPGTNGPVVRVFYLLTKLWAKDKTQFKVSVLLSMFIIKVNVKQSCKDLKSSPRKLFLVCNVKLLILFSVVKYGHLSYWRPVLMRQTNDHVTYRG